MIEGGCVQGAQQPTCQYLFCGNPVKHEGDYCSPACQDSANGLQRDVEAVMVPMCVYGDCINEAPTMGGMCAQHEREVGGVVGVCDYLDCSVKVRPGETLCDEHVRFVGEEAWKTAAQKYEAVDHPKHYNEHPSGIECIDVIEHMPFNIGTAMKYLWRAGLKPGQDANQDLQKAIWYTERQRTIGERTKR